MFSQNCRRRPFWMTGNHVRSHFSSFQNNAQFFFHLMRNFFSHKMAAGGHFGWPKSLSILNDRSYLSAFQINAQLYFFSQMAAGVILDDRKSLSIAFLAISDQYATFCIKMAAGGHFGSPIWAIFLKLLFKMAAGGHFGSPICAKNNRVLPLCVING